MPYLDRRGNPLFSFSELANNRKKVTLTLVDGDEEWDGDGTKNGRVVDPGMIAIDTDSSSTLSYSWQSSSDEINWSEISSEENYTVKSDDAGKTIRVVVSHTDSDNFARSFISNEVKIPGCLLYTSDAADE